MKVKRAFTLVEILVVVVILGILAAIVIPKYSEASTEAKFSNLCSNLHTLRAQIELYKSQHNNTPPSFANFVAQMTGQTDITGAAGNDYGPYLQRIATNHFNGLNTLDNTGIIGDNVGAWEYDETSGEIFADDDYDNDGIAGPDHANL